MGADLGNEPLGIYKLSQNNSSDFIAEVYFEELQFILEKDLHDVLIVKNHGVNSRAESKDVIGVTSEFISNANDYKENLVYHLSRSSIYHQLPEILFYPLTLGVNSKNKSDVVQSIRNNRKREQRNLDFFVPFDTEIFKEKVKINNRHLNFLSDEKAKENLLRISKNLLDVELPISKESIYRLFLNLCNSEYFKENLTAIEELIDIVLGLKIKIKYIPKMIKEMPFAKLGEGILGIDLGLHGQIESEIDDVKVTIQLSEEIKDYDILERNIYLIKTILNFFILSSRNIFVTYEVITESSFTLGNKHLGYDTYLT